MKNKKKILAVVMARSGSKGLKNKNILKINKIPLIGHAGKISKKIKLIDKCIISTDSRKYGNIAKKYGMHFFFLRNKKLSGSKVPDHLVLKDALIKAEKYYNINFYAVVSLPPTTPLRKKNDVIGAINKFIKLKMDSLWTVSKVDNKFHPLKQLDIKNKNLRYFLSKGKNIIYRQQLKDTYFRNGVAYVVSRKLLINGKSLLNKNTGFYFVKTKQISIDSLEDLIETRKHFT